MIPLKAAFGRVTGLTLSLVIHGAVAGIACVTLIGLPGRGGGRGGAGGDGSPLTAFSVGVHFEEPKVDGERVADIAQYHRGKPETMAFEETQVPSLPPFDPFSVGAAPASPNSPPSNVAPSDYPGLLASEDRHSRLPGTSSDSSAETSELEDGLAGRNGGPSGSGVAGKEGEGHGRGSDRGDGSGATQVYTPAPEYPVQARRRGIQGTVVVEVSVLPDGTCTVSRILESSGCEELDLAAQAALRRWKYQPLEREGHPCSSLERVRFVFRLTS